MTKNPTDDFAKTTPTENVAASFKHKEGTVNLDAKVIRSKTHPDQYYINAKAPSDDRNTRVKYQTIVTHDQLNSLKSNADNGVIDLTDQNVTRYTEKAQNATFSDPITKRDVERKAFIIPSNDGKHHIITAAEEEDNGNKLQIIVTHSELNDLLELSKKRGTLDVTDHQIKMVRDDDYCREVTPLTHD